MSNRTKNRGALGFYVSRQSYWGLTPEEGAFTVEVARGGQDAAGPDQLVEKYGRLGECEEYADPREAVRVAAKIVMAWRKDEDTRLAEYIHIGFGDNWDGMFGSFDHADFGSAMAWANEEWDKLPKCAECGKPFDPEHGWSLMDWDEFVYCSETCVDSAKEYMDDMNLAEDMEEYGFTDNDEVWIDSYGRLIEDITDVREWQDSYCGTAKDVLTRINRRRGTEFSLEPDLVI